MLEFIVLGIIPGTQIQLSPMGVVLLWAAIVLLSRILMILYRYHRLLLSYETFGTYFTVVARKHLLTRRLRSYI